MVALGVVEEEDDDDVVVVVDHNDDVVVAYYNVVPIFAFVLNLSVFVAAAASVAVVLGT